MIDLTQFSGYKADSQLHRQSLLAHHEAREPQEGEAHDPR